MVPLYIAAGLVAATLLYLVLRPQRVKRDELHPVAYEYLNGRPRSPGQAMADFGSRLQWGAPSLRTWELACDLSRERSHARRKRTGG